MEALAKKNLDYFFISFILTLPIFWVLNVYQQKLEDFLFWHKISQNAHILAAQISLEEKWQEMKPIRNKEIPDLEIEAKSAISVLIDKEGKERTLFEKESGKKLAIASLSKLMTSYVVLENYDLSQAVKISREVVEQEGTLGNLKTGETFRVKDLLYPLLIESSNTAAAALADAIGEKSTVGLMNLEAENLGLENTYFANSTGLDPENHKNLIKSLEQYIALGLINYSTAKDLVKLADHLLKTKPLIWEISAIDEINFYSSDGALHHRLKNTNELLKKITNIVGGKTGDTPKAQGCLILVLQAPHNKGYLINIILGSQDRFNAMEKLTNWVKEAYKW